MARDHTPTKKEKQPVYIEREVTLSLLNQKINEAVNLLYKIADKTGVSTEEEN